MEERDKEVIRHMYVRLLRNLEATKLMGYLYQEHVLNEEDMDKIEAKKTTKKKAEKLLKILKKRKNGLKMLIKALLVTEIQAFLGHELLERVTWSQEDIESLRLEVEGKINPLGVVELKVATLQQKINQLVNNQEKMKKDYEKTIKELNEKVVNLQMKLDDVTSHSPVRHPSSPDQSKEHGVFFRVFRKRSAQHQS